MRKPGQQPVESQITVINAISQAAPPHKRHRLKRILTRFSLLWVLAGAALAIAALLLQGQSWIATLHGTPLPSFYLEDSLQRKPLPDKTKVYQSTLATTRFPQTARKQVAAGNNMPWWQRWQQTATPSIPTALDSLVSAGTQANNTPSTRRKRKRRRHSVTKPKQVVSPDTLPVSLFQPVKAEGAVASLNGKPAQRFVACQVHGDQQLTNQQRIVLRLSEPLVLDNQPAQQIYPAGTLLYGSVQFALNKISISISRINEQAVAYRVYDHTYHEGILLEPADQRLEQATTDAALQQAGQSMQQLPARTGLVLGTVLGKNLLNAARQRPNTFFLPDGYPLFIVQQKTTTSP